MVLKNGDSKRIGIFFFYDKDGIVDDYVYVLLDALKNHFRRIVVVVNGILSVEGRRKISAITSDIVVRENTGFDSWAYKTGLEHIGWKELENYEELVMFNFTIMGPVNSFDEMFEAMDARDLDFWGITKWFKVPYDPFGCIKYGYIPEHLQSHFIAVRKSMFMDNSFKKYWSEFPMINSYDEAVGKHEAIFTKHFSDVGFSWDSYVNMDDLQGHNWGEIMFNPIMLVKERKCPIFKRKLFFQDYGIVLGNSVGNIPSEFLDFLVKENRYDINLILDNVFRTANQEDFTRNLNYHYVLSSKNSGFISNEIKSALFIHVYYEDMIEQLLLYARNMPDNSDIYITVVNSKTYDEVINKLKKHHDLKDRTEVRIIQNRGRDVGSLLVGVKDVIMHYDIACFIHDKKVKQVHLGSIGEGFANICYGNTVCSKAYVQNVIDLFESEKRMGIAVPPFPSHADFFGGIGNEWGASYDITYELYKKLGLTVPISHDKKPIAPYGSCFWFRPIALKKLYELDWDYDDFPKEPSGIDGTIMHAVERIHPFVAQQMNYYPAVIMSDFYAGIEYAELEYYLRNYNRSISRKVGMGYFNDVISKIDGIETSVGMSHMPEAVVSNENSSDSMCNSELVNNDHRTPAGPTWKRTIYWMLFDHDMLKWKLHHKFHKAK